MMKKILQEIKFDNNFIYIASVILFLLFFSTMIALISLDAGARVVNFNYRTDQVGEAQAFRQSFSWEFTRPLALVQDIAPSEYVRIEPEVPGTTRLIGNRLQFIPSEVLKYGQEYNLTLNTELVDIYGNKIERWGERITTKEQRIVFQRNFDGSAKTDLAIANLAGTRENNIVEDVFVRDFAVDFAGNRVAYAIQDNILDGSELFIYDIHTNLSKQINVNGLQIDSLTFDQYGTLYMLGTTSDRLISVTEIEDLPEFFTLPYYFDEESKSLVEFVALEWYYGNIASFEFFSNGQIAVVAQFSNEYDIVLLPTGSPTPLGVYNVFDKISYSGEFTSGYKIDFTEDQFIPRATVSDVEQEIFSTESDFYAKDPNLDINGNLLAVSRRLDIDLDYAEGVFELYVFNINQENIYGPRDFLPTPTNSAQTSIDLAKFSFDSKFLAVELTALETLQSSLRQPRVYVNAGRPVSVATRIYDLSSQPEVVLDLDSAYNLTWVY